MRKIPERRIRKVRGDRAQCRCRLPGRWVERVRNGCGFRDIDNDGKPDIVFVALPNETFQPYHNSGKGIFDADAFRSMDRLTRPMGGYSPELCEFPASVRAAS
jgi:hypothetical protein